MTDKLLEILLIEDNPADVRLTAEALRESKTPLHLSVVGDGLAAMRFLHREGQYSTAPRPDLILLDLNLPHKDGRQVLAEIKKDTDLRCIPVVIFTSSEAPADVLQTYDLAANCYVNKPVDLDEFIQAVKTTEDFWGQIARLPLAK